MQHFLNNIRHHVDTELSNALTLSDLLLCMDSLPDERVCLYSPLYKEEDNEFNKL